MKNKSKSLGLGLKNIPIFHSVEDVIFENENNLYQKQKYKLPLKNVEDNLLIIETFVHDPQKMANLKAPGDYVESLNLLSYQRKKFGYTFCYIVENQELFNVCLHEFKNDNFRNKK